MVDNQNILPIASVKKQNVKSAKNAGAQIIRSCICIKCHLYVLYFLAWIFTIWLLFMCLWNSHENDVRGDLYNTFSKKSNIDKESCDGKGIGIHTNMYLNNKFLNQNAGGKKNEKNFNKNSKINKGINSVTLPVANKKKCERTKQINVKPIDVLNSNSPTAYYDKQNEMFHTIMHPKHVSSNLLHNFAPVFAPTSTLSKENGYAWYGIAGIDGVSANNRYALGIYLLRSKNGIDWELGHDRRAILRERDLRYFKKYHSAFDGQNRIVYDNVLDIFFLFTRANVGPDARSFQRSMSRNLNCYTDMIPITTQFETNFLGPEGEQYYTHSVFQLPQMYPGVFFAIPRRHSCAKNPGTTAFMHSYDYGNTWRRTNGFEPFMSPGKADLKSDYGDYVLDAFGGRYNRKRNSIDFFNMRFRTDFEIWPAPLLGNKANYLGNVINEGKKKVPEHVALPRVASLSTIGLTIFTTYPILFPNKCDLYVDFESDNVVPKIGLIDRYGADLPKYRIHSSKINGITGKISWMNGATTTVENVNGKQKDDVMAIRLKFEIESSNAFHLFAIHCKDVATNARKRNMEDGKDFAEALLSNKYAIINKEEAYYQKSHREFLESHPSKQKVNYEFWHGRIIKSIYMLDLEFINETKKGEIKHNVIKPLSRSSSSIYDSNKEQNNRKNKPLLYMKHSNVSQLIYPHIVDASKDGLPKDDNLCGLDRNNQYPIRLFLNAYPLKYISGGVAGGLDHFHDYYNHVKLYMTKSLDDEHNSDIWKLPKKSAEKNPGYYCPAVDFDSSDWPRCLMSFGFVRHYGIWNLRTGDTFRLMHLSYVWLYLLLVPWSIFFLCIICANNLSSVDRSKKIFLALRRLVMLALIILVMRNVNSYRCVDCLHR